MSLYEWKKIQWKMSELSVSRVLEEMEKAKRKAIRRAKKYDTMPPVFTRQLKWGVRKNFQITRRREPASPYRVLEDYVEAIDWEFRTRISEEESPKKQRKLFKKMKAITRPCRVYYSSAAILVTRAIRKMAVHLKKVRGEHWYDIRKKNAQMIEWDMRNWCRSRNYTDSDEEQAIRECCEIRNALRGELPEDRREFERIAMRFDRRHRLPEYWWDWWTFGHRRAREACEEKRLRYLTEDESLEIRWEEEKRAREQLEEEMRQEEIDRLEELQERMRDYGSD